MTDQILKDAEAFLLRPEIIRQRNFPDGILGGAAELVEKLRDALGAEPPACDTCGLLESLALEAEGKIERLEEDLDEAKEKIEKRADRIAELEAELAEVKAAAEANLAR